MEAQTVSNPLEGYSDDSPNWIHRQDRVAEDSDNPPSDYEQFLNRSSIQDDDISQDVYFNDPDEEAEREEANQEGDYATEEEPPHKK